MNITASALIAELRSLVAGLGAGGGLMSPAIYDTAQLLRAAPPTAEAPPALTWLLAQQRPDGGWGSPNAPLARTGPTLAAALAVVAHRGAAHPAVEAALGFLEREGPTWSGPLPEDLPAGVELIVPALADQAAALSLPLAVPYESLRRLGERRRAMLARLPARPGTAIVHSWEAWGSAPDPALFDGTGSVGHSPAATVAWLSAARGRGDLAAPAVLARRYLERAAAVTRAGVPGVVPTVWPMDRYEQTFSLYMLLIAGLLGHPALAHEVRAQVSAVESAMRPGGLGYSDWFLPDGDDTAAACAVLAGYGRPPRLDALAHFAAGDHYCTWQGELQTAVSVTAHAIHALRLSGRAYVEAAASLLREQRLDGRWVGDKWNRSWVYTTGQALVALSGHTPDACVRRGVDALLAGQHPCGGWGEPAPSGEETAYATLALRALGRDGALPRYALAALERGEAWLLDPRRRRDGAEIMCWMAKESYRPERIARVCELAAMVVAAEAQEQRAHHDTHVSTVA